jgi:hypothetical protein
MEKSNGMSVFCSWGFHTFLNKEHAKGIQGHAVESRIGTNTVEIQENSRIGTSF